MSGLIDYLESINTNRVRAILRRSLSFEPGTHIEAFPFIEPFCITESTWSRYVNYLVGGLWAMHWREDLGNDLLLPKACAKLRLSKEGSDSTERRFIALLDANEGQLGNRLRNMVSLLKEYPIDFNILHKDLIHWNSRRKSTQLVWAKKFYAELDQLNRNVSKENKE